ncbi:MAG: HYR domain-containing protein [Bacteroidetes bacterium]|nr:MAG: HYR domain-containing protein [Bacteroidota bacterium]
MKPILFTFLFSGITTLLSAQWTQVGGVIQHFSQRVTLTQINGAPYVGFANIASGGDLFVQTFDGTSWNPVGMSASGAQATFPQIEVDANGDLYAGFATTLGEVNVKKWSNGAWVSVGAENFANAFALDFKIYGNDLYVAYSDGDQFGTLSVKKFENGAWTQVGMPGLTVGGIEYPSLGFDNAGAPYVAFRDFSNGQGVTVLKFNSGTGNWEGVGNAGFSDGAAQFTDLRFDGNVPYVAFKDEAHGSGASLMAFDNGAWKYVGTPGFSDGQAEYVSLAFFNGIPLIAFNDDAQNDESSVYYFEDNQWQKLGDSFGAGVTSYHNLLVEGTTAYCAFAEKTSDVVLYRFELSCLVVGLETTAQDPACNGMATGSATALATNATNPVAYAWSNGATGATITGLPAGTYFVTMTDGNGCEKTDSVTLSDPPALVGTIVNQTNADCSGMAGGSATVGASGGTPDYTFLWSTGGTDPAQTDLPIGTHTVTITDAKGCETTLSVTISGENDTTPPVAVAQDLTVALDAQGNAAITPDMLNNGSSDNCQIASLSLDVSQFTCADLGANTVTLTVADVGGNTATATAVVTVVDLLDPVIVCPADILSNFCNAPVEYDLPVATDACGGIVLTQFQGLPSGAVFPMGVTQMVFAATDASGNQATCSFTVTVQNDLSLNMTATPALCYGENSGTATAQVSGGNMPYAFQWNDPLSQKTATATNLPAGIFAVTVVDDKGCGRTDSVEVTQPDSLHLQIDSVVDATGNLNDGAISITPSGGVGGYTFEWSFDGAPFATGEDLTNLAPGEYCVTLTDANGCTKMACVVVDMINATQNPALENRISVAPNPTSGPLRVGFDLPAPHHVRMEVRDALGRVVWEEKTMNLTRDQIEINLPAQPGIYWLRVSVNADFVLRKIVVTN